MSGTSWGTSIPSPTALVYGTASSADVTLTADTPVTMITTGALTAPSNGPWYPIIHLVVAVLLGSSASTALTFKFILGAGSAVDTYTVEPGMLVNSAEFTLAIPLVGVVSTTAWVGSGSTINIQGTATTNDATAKGVGTRALVELRRGAE